MRRIQGGKIRFLSLVPRGANRLVAVLKDDGSFSADMICKEMTEAGEIHALVYVPELRDSQGDIASAAAIKDLMYESAKGGVRLDLRHDNKPLTTDQAFLAEQFLVQKGDPRFKDLTDYQGNPVDATGGWGVVVKVQDEGLKNKYRTGEWRGISMDGDVIVKHEHKAAEEDEVKPEDIEKVAKAVALAVAEGMKVTKAAEAPTTPPAPSLDLPKFTGDPTKKEDVEAHRDAIRAHGLRRRLESAKTASEVDAILKEMSDPPVTAPAQDEATVQKIKKLEAEIVQLQKGSVQPTGTTTVTKKSEVEELHEMGVEIAKHAARIRGR